MGGKGSSAPDPIDPGKSMGEYLFGSDFGSAQGITDPVLQERLLSAEAAYRPRYTALELADINTMAYGIEAGAANPEYQRLNAELEGLRAGEEFSMLNEDERRNKLQEQAKGIFDLSDYEEGFIHPNTDKGKAGLAYQYINAGMNTDEHRQERIVQLETQLGGMSETLDGQAGLFDMLESSSQRAFDLQQDQLVQQREADVAALEEFSPRAVEAYRAADPYSTGMAEYATSQAETLYNEAEGELSPERRRMADQAARQSSAARGRVMDEGSMAQEIMNREAMRSQLRNEARTAGGQAFSMNRSLAGDLGSTILGRPSQGIQLGQQVLGQAQAGAAQPMGPQLFDPNVGLNMAYQNQANQASYAGANAASGASTTAAVGAIGGAAITAI